jgi:hypothetical protein
MYEWVPIFVAHSGDDGLVDRMEFYAPEDWDAALARFDELAAAEPADERSLELENAAMHVGRRGLRLAVAGHWDEYRAQIDPGMERVARRRTVSAPPALVVVKRRAEHRRFVARRARPFGLTRRRGS